jgi:hypothetical protein
MFTFNKHIYTPEYGIVDVEECRVDRQPKCVVTDGIWKVIMI